MRPSTLSLRMRAEDALLAGRITKSEFDIYVRAIEEDRGFEDAPEQSAQPVEAPTSIVTKPLDDIPELELPMLTMPSDTAKQTASTPTTDPSASNATPAIPARHQNTVLIGMVLLVIAIGIFSTMQLGDEKGALSGLAILDLPEQNFTNSTIPVPYTIVGLRMTGTMHGDGTATMVLRTTTAEYLIGTVESSDGSPMTQRPGYEPGQKVMILNAPSDATYYLDDGSTSIQVNPPFDAPATDATLLIVANESGELATYRLPIRIGAHERVTAFTSLCEETCTLPPTDGEIIITTTGDAHIEIATAEVTVDDNRPPTLAVPFSALDIDTTTVINLSAHFNDIDGDDLLYSTSSSALANLVVDGETLTITPLSSGTDEIAVYASDLQELVPASMTLTVRMPASPESTVNDSTVDGTNATMDGTTNTTEQNDTTVTPPDAVLTNETNTTGTPPTPPTTLDCDDPNPNARPVECLLDTTTNYFPDQDIYWESGDRTRVARFSTVGNLLITGDVIENDPSVSPSYDFSLGHYDIETYVPTIWIDNEGNLHLHGLLHEESQNFVPPPGSYSFNNKRGVTLAYADLQTGDLYLRGNLIPYRRNIE